MEGGPGPGFDGTEAARIQGRNIGPSPSRSVQFPGYILRILAIVLTFISAIVMGVAKEPVTVIVSENSGQTMDTFTGSIKSTYSSTFVYGLLLQNTHTHIYIYIDSCNNTSMNKPSSEIFCDVELLFSNFTMKRRKKL